MEVLIDGVKYVPAPPTPTGKTFAGALDLRFDSAAGDDLTMREYLHELMRLLWAEQDGFNGKLPFGNSAWEFDIYVPLAKAGFIDLGPVDDGGEPFNWTTEQVNTAHAYVHDLIAFAFFGAADE